MNFNIPSVFSKDNAYAVSKSLKHNTIHTKAFYAFMFVVIVSTLLLKKSEILPRFFLKPPKNWLQRFKDNLKKIIGDEVSEDVAKERLIKKTVRINFGGKNGCIRRWLLLNSNDPHASLAYSNYRNIAPVKAKNDGLTLSLKDRLNFDDLCANVSNQNSHEKFIIGIFHPFCNSGGGGERVLWELCKAILDKYENNKSFKIAIYTGDVDIKPEDIIEKVKFKFGIDLDIKKICFIYLEGRHRVEGKSWPVLTLLLQAISSILLLKDAISKLPPDCFIDTMGYPFVYPIMKFLYDIPIVSYTHYPIIQKDMLSMHIPFLKRLYWLSLYSWYKLCGYFVDYSIVNSTWTKNHMDSIWKMINNNIIYPPCLKAADTTPISNDHNKKWQCVLVAQYRPEKRHELAIKQYKKYLDSIEGPGINNALNLTFIGSIRSDDDKLFMEKLKYLAHKTLKIPENKLVFKVNLSYPELLNEIKDSQFGLNTMWNEHFGISVVEYFANNTIPLAHASAGPLLDIVGPVLKDNSEFSDFKDKLFFIDDSDPDFNTENEKKYSQLFEVFKFVDSIGPNSSIWKEMGIKGYNYVLSKFSNEKFDQDFNELVLNTLVNDILKAKSKRAEADIECQ
ncbi:related to GDP-Man:Man(3)GlcNAc(2)-PP-Dol alpha-1,2-mannosyltransferase [Hanseniaspora guilliermondii]|uniref:GDP-Man:Man(3)GlcNAc(2)-PP-Dol alpha-1,2-mannosyltransferase n=1 Tax=Hanseniaspora guilliermondii TaxID=56406 RepID=A0A1L0CUK3_9ASCO|nr:related to GDP-Man:Man(3)GlcNAc(2)-PP-Dol alpha-1,2-mannosyltransferase [Hanseniaspora guilliermondii]